MRTEYALFNHDERKFVITEGLFSAQEKFGLI